MYNLYISLPIHSCPTIPTNYNHKEHSYQGYCMFINHILKKWISCTQPKRSNMATWHEDNEVCFMIHEQILRTTTQLLKMHNRHLSSSCKNPVKTADWIVFSYLNNADRFPWQMVCRVEEKSEEKNETAIPAKESLKWICGGKQKDKGPKWSSKQNKYTFKLHLLYVLPSLLQHYSSHDPQHLSCDPLRGPWLWG